MNLQDKSIIEPMKVRESDDTKIAQISPLSPSFEDLFLEHWTHVYRWLVRLVGDPAEAQDLALETFFRLYQHHPTWERGFNLAGWLHRVATNLGLRSIRSYQRRERYELAAGKAAVETAFDDAAEDRPAEVLASKEERRVVRLVLAQMNSRQAELLVMRYSGMAYKDIARALGLSPTSIGPLLVRAERSFEKHYRTLLEEEA